MKQHIGSIYLILGLMSVSALTIGAGNPQVAKGEHSVRAQALLPSPTSFQVRVGDKDKTLPDRILVISSGKLEADIDLKVAKAIAAARVRKAG
jgi:hypothetical protein